MMHQTMMGFRRDPDAVRGKHVERDLLRRVLGMTRPYRAALIGFLITVIAVRGRRHRPGAPVPGPARRRRRQEERDAGRRPRHPRRGRRVRHRGAQPGAALVLVTRR